LLMIIAKIKIEKDKNKAIMVDKYFNRF